MKGPIKFGSTWFHDGNNFYNIVLRIILYKALITFLAFLAVWADLAKFCHFGKNVKPLDNFVGVSVWQNYLPTLAIFYAIVVNDQILNK